MNNNFEKLFNNANKVFTKARNQYKSIVDEADDQVDSAESRIAQANIDKNIATKAGERAMRSIEQIDNIIGVE